MNEQNYANHARYVRGFHFLLGSLLIIGIICSFVNVWVQWSANKEIFSAVLMTLLFICGLQLFWYSRQFAIKAQDRAIRAEENLRYFILTSKPLDRKITMAQIIALRFAPDEEFLELVDRTVNENLSPVEIKKAIRNWKADHHRA